MLARLVAVAGLVALAACSSGSVGPTAVASTTSSLNIQQPETPITAGAPLTGGALATCFARTKTSTVLLPCGGQ